MLLSRETLRGTTGKERSNITLQTRTKSLVSELCIKVLHSHLVQVLVGRVGSAPQDLRAAIPPSRLKLPPQCCQKRTKDGRKKSEAKTMKRDHHERKADSPGSICFSRLKANTRRVFRSPILLFVFKLKTNLINGMAKNPAAYTLRKGRRPIARETTPP